MAKVPDNMEIERIERLTARATAFMARFGVDRVVTVSVNPSMSEVRIQLAHGADLARIAAQRGADVCEQPITDGRHLSAVVDGIVLSAVTFAVRS